MTWNWSYWCERDTPPTPMRSSSGSCKLPRAVWQRPALNWKPWVCTALVQTLGKPTAVSQCGVGAHTSALASEQLARPHWPLGGMGRCSDVMLDELSLHFPFNASPSWILFYFLYSFLDIAAVWEGRWRSFKAMIHWRTNVNIICQLLLFVDDWKVLEKWEGWRLVSGLLDCALFCIAPYIAWKRIQVKYSCM